VDNQNPLQVETDAQDSAVRHLYKRRARHYDFSANLYYLAGFREYAYRKQAVALLNLKPGDTVVEVGCGTGLNFAYLQEKIGPDGKIIGVDLTTEMLEVARQRCRYNGWSNVELVEHDAASFNFPQQIDGVISSFALTLVPEYPEVIMNAATALKPGKHMVVLDLQLPHWPLLLVRLGILLTSGFGVTEEIAKRHPWETMQTVFGNLEKVDAYFGAVYLAMSERSARTLSQMTH